MASQAPAAEESNWPQFRGPGSRGLPVEWSAEKNIAWKAEVPVVWGGKSFITSAAGGGVASGFTASPWAHDGKMFCLNERAETIEQEVEDLEHHLRPQTLATLGKLVSYWQAYPEHLQSFLRFSRKK